ncbi:Apoptosis regulator BAX [Lamellibrachia satsuma]|nr:Apoptosis regulator BAX [Lamellibrachia satsuma]
MAEGGEGDKENPFTFGKKRKASLNRSISRYDIGNQARLLMSQFIHDRMQVDGFSNAPTPDVLIEPGTPSGPPVEHVREVAQALRAIGDELDKDDSLQKLIKQIPPNAPSQTFLFVAKEIFADGVFNWGRVVTLFYFAYKMIAKAIQQSLNTVPLIRSIVEWVVNFIIEYVAPWIIERGGWSAIQEYFGTPSKQATFVFLAGVVASIYIFMRHS